MLLVLRGYFSSREKSSQAIKAGVVRAGNTLITKPATKVDVNIDIVIETEYLPYVSKGGLKLEKAIKTFPIDFSEKIILDVGCSIGGFTDCAIQHGAGFVYGIDVGSNQLDKKLVICPKLKSIENLHVKDLHPEHLDNNKMDGILIDVSFISSTVVIPYVLPFLKDNGFLFLLIKPQFELDASALDRNGIVKNIKNHIHAIERVLSSTKEMKLYLQNIDYAPLMTYKKNIEYIALFRFTDNNFSANIHETISMAMKEKSEMERI